MSYQVRNDPGSGPVSGPITNSRLAFVEKRPKTICGINQKIMVIALSIIGAVALYCACPSDFKRPLMIGAGVVVGVVVFLALRALRKPRYVAPPPKREGYNINSSNRGPSPISLVDARNQSKASNRSQGNVSSDDGFSRTSSRNSFKNDISGTSFDLNGQAHEENLDGVFSDNDHLHDGVQYDVPPDNSRDIFENNVNGALFNTSFQASGENSDGIFFQTGLQTDGKSQDDAPTSTKVTQQTKKKKKHKQRHKTESVNLCGTDGKTSANIARGLSHCAAGCGDSSGEEDHQRKHDL